MSTLGHGTSLATPAPAYSPTQEIDEIPLRRFHSNPEASGTDPNTHVTGNPIVDALPILDYAATQVERVTEAVLVGEAVAGRPRRKGFVQMCALCWMMFLIGWNDGATGPLLPRIQQVYNVNYTIVSLLFVANCVGVIVAGMVNVYLAERLAFGKVTSALSIVGYIIQAPAPPFPVFVLAMGIIGFSMTLQDIHSNGYVASMQKSSGRLGVLHCAYGIGAFAAPLASTQFAQLSKWSFIYIVSLFIAALNVVALALVFRLRSLEECLLEIGEPPARDERGSGSVFSQLLHLKTLYFLALFILAYVGTEVTIGGWIVTYTIDERGGGPSAGYISSGFFGGLALGRILLLQVTKKLGNRLAVLLYVLLAISLELIVWLVPSLISSGIAISLAGLVLGPIFPVTVHQAGRLFPRTLLNGAISIMAAAGTAGSAGVPFLAGLLAQGRGIWSLQPLLVSLMTVMAGLWVAVPKGRPRAD
ncbi:MFS general substrate transporter [Vararia minispora EC-137]|uniref:MFS general substrate transporter n=1 Tax=Vararia minispora EC-137 TaxID=1314806 RepID=A0ACB8QHS6_9AGAM|nr:MFS general substrate transporter [Vararia minispora EC-137]